MPRRRLLECSFLIPIRRDRDLSDGSRHPPQAWKTLQDELHDFGGATHARELYEGWYVDSGTGKRVTDLSKKYTVAIPRSKLRRLRTWLQTVCSLFHQKCIYLSVAGYVEFVEGPSHETI